MSKVSTNINLDMNLKKQAKVLFADLGMDLTTAVTIFIKQSLREKGLPFKPSMEITNKTTIKAIKEKEEMLSNSKKYKRYKSINEVLDEVK